MSSRLLVDLFVEDRAHEQFLTPLLARVAREEGAEVDVRVRSARGGHGRAVEEFKLYQNVVEKGAAGSPDPDLLIVAIDGNCTSVARKRTEIQDVAKPVFRHRLIVACPDPHIERWYLGDPESFRSVVGHRPAPGRKKCVRDHYKSLLSKAVRQARHPATLGGIEFARELVDAMDLYRAGRIDHSLKVFVDELRAGFRDRRPAGGATAP